MFNFGTFWNQFGQFAKESQFDKHFEKGDTFQTMLDDDLIITEFKNSNQKLMQFMKYDEFKQLIEYIIDEPKDDSDPKRAFRYPFYACELLCCDNVKVTDTFFPKDDESVEDQNEEQTNQFKARKPDRMCSVEITQMEPKEVHKPDSLQSVTESNEEQKDQEHPDAQPEVEKINLFQHLCSFITNLEGELNLVLAGYFSKVFCHLMQAKPEQVLNTIYNEEDNKFFNKLIQYLHSKSLSEILTKLLIIEKEQPNCFLENRKGFLIAVMQVFVQKGPYNFEFGANIQTLISDMCQKAYSMASGKELLQELLHNGIFHDICALMTNQNNAVSINASTIVYYLFYFALNDDIKNNLDNEDNDSLQIDISQALEELTNSFPQIFEYLRTEQCASALGQRQGLGQTKLKLVEIITLVLRLKFDQPKNRLAHLNLFEVLNPLLVKYPSNNLFHLQYHKIVTTIVEQNQEPLLENLFTHNKFIKFLLELTKDPQSPQKKKNVVNRKGYLGFIAKIGKFLDDFGQKNQQFFQQYLSLQEWETFKEVYLIPTQKTNEKDLGNCLITKDTGDFDFTNDQISQKYQGFLTQPPANLNQQSGDNGQQISETTTVKAQQQVYQIFDNFSTFQISENSAANQSNNNFGAFEGFSWSSNGNTASNEANNNFGFNEKEVQPNNEVVVFQEQLYWKPNYHEDFQKKVLEEFEASL